MAYSRKTDESIWYVFWTATGPSNEFKLPTQKLKDQQLLCIHDTPSYLVTYGELKKNFKRKVKEIEEFYFHDYLIEGQAVPAKKPTFKQMCELRRHLLTFISDVDEHFKWKKFFRNEWYSPFVFKYIRRYKLSKNE